MEKNKTVEVGRIYELEGQKYVIDEIGFNKVYGYQVDESHKPYGRRRILGSLKKERLG